MFRHILVPTDGSALARKAGALAARLARRLGARIAALYVIAEGVPTAFSGGKLYGSGVLGKRYRERARAEAAAALAAIGRDAREAGVPFAALRRTARDPWRAIISAARARRCDLIVMASHGRSGVRAIVLGSQAAKVLTHSRIPVLVCR